MPAYLVLLVLLALFGSYVLYSSERAGHGLAAVVFLGPFAVVSVTIGVRWDAYKILMIGLWSAVGMQVLGTGCWPSGRRPRLNGYLYLFLVWALVCTLINFGDPLVELGGPEGFFRGPSGRPIVQMISLLLDVSAFLLPMAIIGSWDRMRLPVMALLFAAFLLSVYGLYQWYAMGMGLPVNSMHYTWSPAGWQVRESSRGVFIYVGGHAFPRIYSLGGEPKGLAKTLALAISAVICIRSMRARLYASWLSSSSVLALLVLVLVLTFSTAGWVTTLVMVPVVIGLARFPGSGGARAGSGLSTLAQIAIVIALLGYAAGAATEPIVNKRLLEREYFADEPEVATWEYLNESPVHWVFGAGAGGLSSRIRPYVTGWAAGASESVLAPNSYPLDLLGSYGIPGLFLFFLFVGSEILRALRIATSTMDTEVRRNLLPLLAMALAACIFVTGFGIREFWLALGLLAAGTSLAERAEAEDHGTTAAGYRARVA